MRLRVVIFVALFSIAISAVCFGQQKQTKVRRVTAPYTSPSSPEEMYKAYCASCHGADGKGNGPAASAMKAPVTDLTALSKNNGGQFPQARVNAVLTGARTFPAHGSEQMPVWGPMFRKMAQGHDMEMQLRINNLNKYLESIQSK